MDTVLLGVGPTHICENIDISKVLTCTHLCANARCRELVEGLESKLNYLFGEGRHSFAFPGSGSSAMEACLQNVIESGDKVVVGVAGVFGKRIALMASRLGANVICVESEPGQAVDLNKILKIVISEKVKLVCIVHIETSFGVIQPIHDELSKIRSYGTFVMLDVVASYGGVALELDKWGIDIAYASTQKCLSSIAGLSLVSMNHRMLDYVMKKRKSIWYWDFDAIYEHNKRGVYPYTTPIILLYMLDECLNVIHNMGKDKYFEKQKVCAQYVEKNMSKVGFFAFADKTVTAPNMRVFNVPIGYDAVQIVNELYRNYHIEVATGINDMKKSLIRIGTLGLSANMKNINALVKAMRRIVNK